MKIDALISFVAQLVADQVTSGIAAAEPVDAEMTPVYGESADAKELD